MKASTILGINARTQLYTYKYNSKVGKNVANSKIQTAKVLKKAGIAHPKIYKKFRDPREVISYDWSRFPDQFALKPSRGLGGEGIIVVKKRLEKNVWLSTQKEKITVEPPLKTFHICHLYLESRLGIKFKHHRSPCRMKHNIDTQIPQTRCQLCVNCRFQDLGPLWYFYPA